jgi:hypothetical protein
VNKLGVTRIASVTPFCFKDIAVDEITDIGERLLRELPVPPTNDPFDRLLARIKEAELRQHGQTTRHRGTA